MFHPSFNSDHVIVDLVDVFVQPVHHLGLQLGLSAEVLRFKLGGLDNAKDSIELFVLVVQVLTLLEQQLLVCLTLGVFVFAIVFISFSVNTCFNVWSFSVAFCLLKIAVQAVEAFPKVVNLLDTLFAFFVAKSGVLALVGLIHVRQPLQILQISRQSVVGGTSEVELFGGAGVLGELGVDVVQLVLETTKEPVRLLSTGLFLPTEATCGSYSSRREACADQPKRF